MLSSHPHLAIASSPPHTAGDTSSKPLSGKLLLISEGFSLQGGRRWGMNPVCRVGTHVLCGAVTEPQTIFRLQEKVQGRNTTGEETPYRTSSFSSARHPRTPEPQGSAPFLSSCPPQCLLSPGPQAIDATSSSSPPKPQLVQC